MSVIAQTRDSIIAAGETAPDFTLPNSAKEDWTLADAVRAGDVVLCFFPLAFTGVCETEMKCVDAEMDAWKAKGATVIGISCDSFAVLKAWSDQNKFGHMLLADMHRTVCRQYGLYWAKLNVAQRGTVVIGQDDSGTGTVKWSQSREASNAMTWDEVLAQVG